MTVNPVADLADDTVTTNEDTPVSYNVIANGNFEGSATVTAVTDGANGTVTTDGTTVTYTPTADFYGTDTFTYTVTSGGVTETATITVTVNPVADLADDAVTTAEDTAVTYDVIASGNFEGSAVVTAVTDGAKGTVSTDGTNVTYTPAADFNGTDTCESS